MNFEDERIEYQKLLLTFKAIITCEEFEWPCEIIDISLHGCLLRFKNTWEQHNIEAIYTLTLQASETVEIIMNLSIKHVIDNEVGFKCEHIDIDNSSLLRHLFASNSTASKLLARDLIELTHSV